MKKKNLFIYVFVLILVFILVLVSGSSCQTGWLSGKGASESEDAESTDINNSLQEKEKEFAAVEEEVEEETTPVNLWIDEATPEAISIRVRNELRKAFDEIKIVDRKEDSNIQVEINRNINNSVAIWILAPVVSFFRNFDDISYEDIKEFWAGNKEALNYISTDGSETELILTEEVFKVLKEILGESENENIKIVTEEELVLNIENNNSFSIVPFDNIEKEYKVLNLDNIFVLIESLILIIIH